MKHLHYPRLFSVALLLMMVASCVASNAGSLSSNAITPGTCTANSVYNYTVIWQDDHGIPPLSAVKYYTGGVAQKLTFRTNPADLTKLAVTLTAEDVPLVTDAKYYTVKRLDVLNCSGFPDNWADKVVKVEVTDAGLTATITLSAPLPADANYDVYLTPPTTYDAKKLYLYSPPPITGTIQVYLVKIVQGDTELSTTGARYDALTGAVTLKEDLKAEDVGDYNIGLAFSATPISEDNAVVELPSSIYSSFMFSRNVVYTMQSPVMGIASVVDAADPTICYPVDVLGSDLSIGRIAFQDAVPLGTKVKVNYYVGPIELSTGGLLYHMAYAGGDIISGATYRVRMSAGLNLANVPNGVPGIVYCPELYKTDPPRAHVYHIWASALSDDGKSISTVELLKQSGPLIYGSSGYPECRLVRVVPTSVTKIQVTSNPADLPFIYGSSVKAIYVGIEPDGINYAVGATLSRLTGEISLASSLPAATVTDPTDPENTVWVQYIPGGVNGGKPRYSGGGNIDIVGEIYCLEDPVACLENPLTPERDPQFSNANDPYDPFHPDDGATGTGYVFRCVYWNSANLPPRPWLTWRASSEGWYDIDPSKNIGISGVVLFLDALGTGDYEPYFMSKENNSDNDYSDPMGCKYIYRIEPTGGSVPYWGGELRPYWPFNNLYEALQLGRYHYYYACCDDSLTSEDGNLIQNERVQVSPGRDTKWTFVDDWWMQQHNPPYAPARIDFQNPPYYYSNNLYYADIDTYQPGVDGTAYSFKSSEHPIVRPSLTAATAYEEPVFLGTLEPYYPAYNPIYRYPKTGTSVGYSIGHMYAETSTAKSSTVFTFKVLYKSQDPDVANPLLDMGIAPKSIRVYINNAADHGRSGAVEYTPGTPLPTDPHTYVGYDMEPIPGQKADYARGVMYRFRGTLPKGPHSYYFEASDGLRRAHFPVRMDGHKIVSADGSVTAWYEDPNVPGDSQPTNPLDPYKNADAWNNDHIPGPYVNTPPTLSNPSVTPTSGGQGTSFRFKITYSDPDNQRPYSGWMYLQTSDNGTLQNGGIIKMQMLPVDGSAPAHPIADDGTLRFKQGIEYYCDLSSRESLILQPGTRKFRFEFEDDWGYPTNIEMSTRGEFTTYPEGGNNWISGPVITMISGPTLNAGKCEGDLAMTSATLWAYTVNYTHPNNKEPKYVNVYIGKRSATPVSYKLQRIRPTDATHVSLPSIPLITVDGVWIATSANGTQPEGENYLSSFDGITGIVTLSQDLADPRRDVYVTYTTEGITWDAGHQMAKRDPSDVVYSDGVVYEFDTRLAGADQPGDPNDRYVYSFEASDGNLTALYNPAGSDSAYAVLDQAEPFIDSNGDGECNWHMSGGEIVYDEFYTDSNGNSRWDDGPESFIDFVSEFGFSDGIYTPGLDTLVDRNAPGNHADVRDAGSETLTASDANHTVYPLAHELVDGPLPVQSPAPVGVLPDPMVYRNGVLLDADYSGTIPYPNSNFQIPVIDGTKIDLNVPYEDYSLEEIFYYDYGPYVSRVVAVHGDRGPSQFFDYYNSSSDSWYDKANGIIYLGTPMPLGVQAVIDYIHEGEYYVNHVDGQVIFRRSNLPSDIITADYWFSLDGPASVGLNTPPGLTSGRVSPQVGNSTADFTYTVTYTDTDGRLGQAPTYVRVYIDGAWFDMTSTAIGTPDFTQGIVYKYTTRLSTGFHRYHFETSDGSGFALYDATGPKSSPEQVRDIVDFQDPFVNDLQTLTFCNPNPTVQPKVPVGQSVTYSVIYSDPDGDAPKTGHPMVWIDTPNEVLVSGAITANGLTESTLTDSNQNWTINALKGKVLQINSGVAKGRVYIITENTATKITVGAATLKADGIVVGDTFQIGGISLVKRIPSEPSYAPRITPAMQILSPTQIRANKDVVSGVIGVFDTASSGGFNYFTGPGGSYDFSTGIITLNSPLPAAVTTAYIYHGTGYEIMIPTLLEGTHTYHFSAIATVSGIPMAARLPIVGVIPAEYPGPVVINQAPTGNRSPTLDITGFTQAQVLNRSTAAIDKNRVTIILGVYQGATAAGTNYFSGGSYNQDTGVITLGTLLPDLNGDGQPDTNTIWVYHRSGIAIPPHGTTSQQYTLQIWYKDLDGNPPAYHDGVQGYCNAVVEQGANKQTLAMLPVNDQPLNYQVGAFMVADPKSLLAGTYKFHFEACDGWTITRYPASAAADPTLVVNNKPVLSDAAVLPIDPRTGTTVIGNLGTEFTYTVKYSDADNQPPSKIQVRIDDSKDVDLTWTGTNFVSGVVCSAKVKASDLPEPIFVIHACKFSAWDSSLDKEQADDIAVLPQPEVVNQPHFQKPAVTPLTGDINTTFNYSVEYHGFTPPSAVKVVIDGIEQATAMTPDPNDNNPGDLNGIKYTYATKLGTGNHNFLFRDKSGSAPDSAIGTGPNVPADLRLDPDSTEVNVGATVNIDIDLVVVPSKVTTIDLEITPPDGITVEESHSTDGSGHYTKVLQMTHSGQWKIKAHWGGDANNAAIDRECIIDVVALTHRITRDTWDMVCPPVYPSSADPADLFGLYYPPNSVAGTVIARSLRISRWSPAEGVYHTYGPDPTFETLEAGEAFWIKPNKFWSGVSTTWDLEPYGQMVPQTQSYKLPLRRGWNQVGSVFMRNVNWSDMRIRYGGKNYTLADAAKANYTRDYAWGYDVTKRAYFLVHTTSTQAGVRRILEPWIGYWLRTLVEGCELVFPGEDGGDIPPPPGGLTSIAPSSGVRTESVRSVTTLDASDYPPPVPE